MAVEVMAMEYGGSYGEAKEVAAREVGQWRRRRLRGRWR